MKNVRKLLPAVCLLLVSAMLLGTSTFAWFSMNAKVTVTGMEVRTIVNANLFIKESAMATDTVVDSNWSSKLTFSQTGNAAVLEPVSSTNGKNFWYVDASTGVDDNGSKTTGAAYKKLNSSATVTDAELAAFAAASIGQVPEDTTILGYQDYVMELKAVNASDSAMEIRLSKLDLIYKGLNSAEKAFRIGFFVEKADETTKKYTMVSSETLTDVSAIFSRTGSTNFTSGKAVGSSGALADVSNPNTALKIAVTPGKTEFFKVVVRIWLEGEDNTCNNGTFAALSQNWALDFNYELVKTSATTPTAVTSIGSDTVAFANEGTTLKLILTDGKLNNGEIPATYAWYRIDAGVPTSVSTTETATISTKGVYYCTVTTTKGNIYTTTPLLEDPAELNPGT